MILDDVHEPVDSDALHGLQIFLRNRPAGVQLVLASRLDPPLSLPRLRLAGRLWELRAAQMRFSLAEAATLLTRSGVELTAAQVEVLHARTTWTAGGRRSCAASTSNTPSGCSKQTLGWTAPKIRTPAAADRWTWLVIAAHTQLRLARPLAADLRRPWEKPGSARPAHAGSGPTRLPEHPRDDHPPGPYTETQPTRSGSHTYRPTRTAGEKARHRLDLIDCALPIP